jgi:hypothetical protein
LVNGRQFTSFYGGLKRSKQLQGACKSERQSLSSSRAEKQEQYQVALRESLRKMTACRLNHHQKIEEVERKLMVEGANCGNDLISLHRHKL